MRLIKILFRDGEVVEYKHEGRAGGSWTKTLELDGEWVIVRDEYGNTFTYPRDTIAVIETRE